MDIRSSCFVERTDVISFCESAYAMMRLIQGLCALKSGAGGWSHEPWASGIRTA